MEPTEGMSAMPLPGSDALKSANLFEPSGHSLPVDVLEYYKEFGHTKYLDTPAYNSYIRINKVIVGESGAEHLLDIGNALNTETLPTLLDAAGWAFAEVALAKTTASTTDRLKLVLKAEESWQRSLVYGEHIREKLAFDQQLGENEGFRTALNLACAPLIKAVVVGNVRPSLIKQVLLDTSEIAHQSRIGLDQAYLNKDIETAAFHRGFLFELSALMALLYMEDPRYIPLPATARADSGYFHREQTHDISILNQHWGEIRKIIPVEIKSKASPNDKRRYKALIIPGKIRLSVGTASASDTVDAFYDVVHSNASAEQYSAIEQLSTQVREMLKFYQQGISAEGLAMNSLTKFHDSKKLGEYYPELKVVPKTI